MGTRNNCLLSPIPDSRFPIPLIEVKSPSDTYTTPDSLLPTPFKLPYSQSPSSARLTPCFANAKTRRFPGCGDSLFYRRIAPIAQQTLNLLVCVDQFVFGINQTQEFLLNLDIKHFPLHLGVFSIIIKAA